MVIMCINKICKQGWIELPEHFNGIVTDLINLGNVSQLHISVAF